MLWLWVCLWVALPTQAFQILSPFRPSSIITRLEARRSQLLLSNRKEEEGCHGFQVQRKKIAAVHLSASASGETIKGEEYDDDESVENSSEEEHCNILDTVLSRLTNAFPLFVLGSGVVGLRYPSSLQWVNSGNWIELMLALVMMGTGMTLEKKDFTSILQGDNWSAVPAGVLCQFGIMPIAAYTVGRMLLLSVDPSLFLGLVLVGCSPGGTASNLVSLIAGANVALSVLLTACSTLLASFVTPLLVKLLVGGTSISVSGKALCVATSKVVLLPVLLGMIFNAKLPAFSRFLSRFTPFASVILVAAICGGVVAKNASTVMGTSNLLPVILSSVVLLHLLGFGMGYWIPSLRYDTRTARTVSIETGMQNSALAVVLAQSIGAPAVTSLPGAISATAHSCLGSILAAYWRLGDAVKKKNEATEGATLKRFPD